jgi:hypothetical protein
MFPDPESDAEAIDALEKAQKLPPGKERTDASRKEATFGTARMPITTSFQER